MFYTFLKITIGSAIRIFFREIIVLGAENIPSDKPVIIVSNHPSAFMDPLVLGVCMKNELHFFARADIFSPGLGKWFMEKANISPIYRLVDGVDSLEKNDIVFAHGYKLLSEKKTLLLFGEGFTDDKFIRRVKPMKKGSMRIALGAEHKFDFKLGVNIICVGINYSDPQKFRSDLLLSFSKPIKVSEYKNLFLEHNNKAMLELNKEIYLRLKQQIVHVENPENSELLEQLLIISERGINNDFNDGNISLEKRWRFSKMLSEALNKKAVESPGELKKLKEKISGYFAAIKKIKTTNYSINDKTQHSSGRVQSDNIIPLFFFFLFTFPLFLLGIINNYLPVKLSTFLSRKISKRPVFWSGTDMAFSIITVPLYYFIIITCLQSVVNFYTVQFQIFSALLYLIFMPVSGLFAFNYAKKFSSISEKLKFRKIFRKGETETGNVAEMKNSILSEMEKLFGIS